MGRQHRRRGRQRNLPPVPPFPAWRSPQRPFVGFQLLHLCGCVSVSVSVSSMEERERGRRLDLGCAGGGSSLNASASPRPDTIGRGPLTRVTGQRTHFPDSPSLAVSREPDRASAPKEMQNSAASGGSHAGGEPRSTRISALTQPAALWTVHFLSDRNRCTSGCIALSKRPSLSQDIGLRLSVAEA